MLYVKLYKSTEKYIQNMSPEEVKAFISYLGSDKANSLIDEYGYIPLNAHK